MEQKSIVEVTANKYLFQQKQNFVQQYEQSNTKIKSEDCDKRGITVSEDYR